MRKTPLKRKTELRARSQLKRGKPLARSRAKRRSGRNTESEFPETVKAVVRRRSGNRCEVRSSVCTGRAVDFHHRKSRRFHDNRAVNCLHVCISCHRYLEQYRTMAKLMGWIVHSTLDPADVPVRPGGAA